MTLVVSVVAFVAVVVIAIGAGTIRTLRRTVAGLEERNAAAADPDRDPLTGVASWSGLITHLRRARARRTDSDDDIALLAFDIGEFGALNATLGRGAGDLVLTTVATRMQSKVRNGEVLARTSGARFIVALEAPVTAYGARRAASRLLDAIREPFEIDNATVAVDAHAGIAVGRRVDGERLIDDAQTALMKARSDGAHHAVLYTDSLRRDTEKSFHQAQQLKTAVADGELYLAYQPIHRTDDGALAGVEALLRWDSRTFGPVSPVDFIPIAEDTGAIVEIGAWVLQKACEDLQHIAAERDDLFLSVNVSPHQMRKPGFPELVEAVLASTDVAPSSLQLEITESTLARPEEVEQQLLALRHLGVRIALDDVGTGYSSLAQIAALPVDAIKLDRSLISRLGGDDDSGAARVFATLAALGRSLGLDVIAEGVETPEQARIAREAGCSHEQGYLYSRPVKLDEAVAYTRLDIGDRSS
ncbi:MAG: phosphodiesterase [Acidimicrobiales bacterium]